MLKKQLQKKRNVHGNWSSVQNRKIYDSNMFSHAEFKKEQGLT